MSMETVIDIRGDIRNLDPRSKILITIMMIIGVSISIEPFQVLYFGILSIPLIIFYKPSPTFIKKFLLSIPWLISVLIIFIFSIKEDVTIHFLNYSRTYSPVQFAGLITFRFSMSALHTSILIDSEENMMNITEALSALGINENLVTILLLIGRIASSISQQYTKKIVAAKTRGALQSRDINTMFFKLQVMGRILANTATYSDNTADTLSARGFNGSFTHTIKPITSDGLTLLFIMACFWFLALLTPLLRTMV